MTRDCHNYRNVSLSIFAFNDIYSYKLRQFQFSAPNIQHEPLVYTDAILFLCSLLRALAGR